MATQTRFVAKNGLDNNSKTITSVADPVNAQDAATKNFSSNADNLTSGTVTAALIPSLDWSKITTGKPTTLAGYGITDAQPLDADLTALTGLSTTGLVARTGDGTAASRSLAVSGSGLSISNANGVAGNPTITLNATNANTASTVVARDASGNFLAGTITASLAGNASTATKLATAHTISMTGDVTFTSANFDGSANVSGTATLANSGVTAGTYRSVTVDAKGRVTAGSNPTTLASYGITDAVSTASRGVANGIATLDESGLVPSTQLPSYVDDVLEYANLASFPATGEAGKIYVALDTNKTYRWSGTVYVYITSGAVDSVAGKTGVVTLVKGDVGLGNVDNTSDLNKPVSTAQQTALNLKANLASPALTGTPTAPTAAAGTNTTQLATTAFVTAAVSSKVDTAHTHAIADVSGLQAALNDKQVADEDLTAIATLAGTSGFLKKTAANTWALDTNTYLTNNKTITISGDATGTGTTAIALTLANSGISAGTYRSVTVDTKGRVTAGTNPTTLAGYGITDAVQATGSMPLTDALISTASLSTSTTAALQVVDTFAASTYRAAKYMVQASSGTDYQVVEVLMAHNGTSVFMTEYGSVTTGADLVTLDGDISAGNVRLLATPTNATTTIRVVRTAIEV